MEKIEVSIICTAYNHEKYIRECLEGFVIQKTNFKYEVLINDDCSTDNTAKIIKEYEKKYPHIIKPIYQTENQYSKGVPIVQNIILPKVQGKYIAMCEGDDCWIDENKLQIQYDYMEAHQDCYMCVHSYVVNNNKNNQKTNIVRSDNDRDFTLKEIVDGGGGLFATASLFMKREVRTKMPLSFIVKYFGDWQMPVYAALLGKVHYVNKIMCKYNYMAEGSWSARSIDNIQLSIDVYNSRIQFLTNANEYSEYKYNDIFEYQINKNKAYQLYIEEEYKKIKKTSFYRENKDIFSLTQRIIINIGVFSKTLTRFMFKLKKVIKG